MSRPLDIFYLLKHGTKVNTLPVKGYSYTLIFDTQSIIRYFFSIASGVEEFQSMYDAGFLQSLPTFKTEIAKVVEEKIEIACLHITSDTDYHNSLFLNNLCHMLLYVLEIFPAIVHMQVENVRTSFGPKTIFPLESLFFEACSPVVDSLKVQMNNSSLNFFHPAILSTFVKNAKYCDFTQNNKYDDIEPGYLKLMLQHFSPQSKMESLKIHSTNAGTCICNELRGLSLYSIINQNYENILLPFHCQAMLDERKLMPVGHNWTSGFDIDPASDFYRAFISFLLLKDVQISLSIAIYIFSFLPKITTNVHIPK
jgi:hypothetical protein